MRTGLGSSYVVSMFRRQKIRQIAALYASSIVLIMIGFLSSILNTRLLGPQGYGDFKFVGTIFQFLATLSTLGIFSTGGQVLAKLHHDDVAKYELSGALVVIATIISGLCAFGAMVFSLLEQKLFANNLGPLILIFSPIVAISIFQVCIEYILQGENEIKSLSYFRVLPGGLYLILVAITYSVHHQVDLVVCLTLQLIGGTGVVLLALRKIRPKYLHLRENKKLLWHANRRYGWHLYLGILSAVATGYFSTFAISYFLNNVQVGFFSLAQTIASPLTLIPAVVGTAFFKDFAHQDHLPWKVTRATIWLTVATLAVFVLAIKPLVSILYTDKFVEVAPLASVIAIGSALTGIGDYLNRFLGAQGRGKELRNGAIAVGLVQVAGFSILVKFLGTTGAAITIILAGTVYCGMMVFYYKGFKRQVVEGSTGTAVVDVRYSENV